MLKSIDTLEVGMEVSADVMNVNGMLLIPKGTILSDRHLRMLRNWGVDAVHITGVSTATQEPEVKLPPETLLEATKQVNNRFKFVSSKLGVVEAIRQMAIKRTARRLHGINDAALARLKAGGEK
jgi:hypothetical protein